MTGQKYMSIFKKSSFLFIIVSFLFLIIFIGMTYPFIFKINTCITGFFSSDENIAPLWDSWRIKYSFLHGLSFTHTPMIAYPFGVDLYASGFLTYSFQMLFYSISIFTTPALTYNMILIFNLFLSAIFTFILVKRLVKNRMSAFFSAMIFAFCPYQFARAWQHLSLTYNQWIPLVLFLAIRLKESYSRKNRVLFFLSLLLALSFDFSVMYFTVVALGIFLVYVLFHNWKEKLFKNRQLLKEDLIYLRKVAVLGILVFIVLLPQFLPIIKNRFLLPVTTASAHNPYRRAFEDLFAQSARPLSYFLPATVQPVFGKFTEQFIGSPLYGVSFTEHTLYLGWVPMILAFVAFKVWRKKRKLLAFGYQHSAENFYIGFFIFLAIVTWFFSQPPWWQIGPLKIYMPSFFMYKVLPMFRAYCRFGIVLMLAVAVLAGFGLKFVLEKIKSNKAKITIASLACVLVIFEFWNWPPYKVIDVSKVPAVYYWLKEQPEDIIIAEYTLDADSPNEIYKFYQTVHEKRIINGTIPYTEANKIIQSLVNLSDRAVTAKLREWGVKYVLVHCDNYLRTELVDVIDEFKEIPQNTDLRLIGSFPAAECPDKNIMCVAKSGPIDLYEVK